MNENFTTQVSKDPGVWSHVQGVWSHVQGLGGVVGSTHITSIASVYVYRVTYEHVVNMNICISAYGHSDHML